MKKYCIHALTVSKFQRNKKIKAHNEKRNKSKRQRQRHDGKTKPKTRSTKKNKKI
jgi:hypothetical protein